MPSGPRRRRACPLGRLAGYLATGISAGLYALVVLGALVCGANLLVHRSHAAAPEDALIVIRNFTFDPPTLTVAPGTTVTWVNEDDTPHTVTTANRSINSPGLDAQERFSMTFSSPGTIEYFCSLHPHMRGEVVVR
ncbi:MAG: cupredoxin family copper-binding protein [Rhodospirillales bacterium]|nr:cupredoxin family copper-binding protein [Rhodospirillales bacterium]